MQGHRSRHLTVLIKFGFEVLVGSRCQLSSCLRQPQLVVGIVNLSEHISVDHGAGGSVHDTWGWVSGAWDFSLDGALVTSEWKSNPRLASHGLIEPSLVLITADNDDLKVFGASCVPLVVQLQKVSLEWSASRSPRGGVENHNQLVSGNCFNTDFSSVGLDKLSSKEIHPLNLIIITTR